MNAAQKKDLSFRRKRFNQDRKEASKLTSLNILQYPMDLPSLHRAAFGGGRVKFMSTGWTWLDKKHRVVDDAMTEIRILRAYILNNLK